MGDWTKEELAEIDQTEELEVFTRRPDESLSNPVTIWVVRVGDNVFVRAIR
jgi:hypothetical protein